MYLDDLRWTEENDWQNLTKNISRGPILIITVTLKVLLQSFSRRVVPMAVINFISPCDVASYEVCVLGAITEH